MDSDDIKSIDHKIEFKKIEYVCEIKRGQVYSKEFINSNKGNYPVYSSQSLNDGVLGNINKYDFDGEYVTWTTDGAYAGTVFYRKGKFSITNVCGILKVFDNSNLNTKYLSFILRKITKKHVNQASGNPKLMSNVMQEIIIPIPPISIQNKIVEILDKLETYTKDINTGLPLEIEQRKKQYEYYRNKLLDFDNIARERERELSRDYIWTLKNIYEKLVQNNVKYKKLWEIVNFDKKFKGVPKEKQNEILSFKHISANELKRYEKCNFGNVKLLSTGLYDGYIKYNENDNNINYGEIIALPSGGSPIIKYYNGYFIDSLNIIFSQKNKKECNLKFIYYFLIANKMLIEENYRGASVKHPNMIEIIELLIPIPHISIQNKIVEILDKLEAYTKDIGVGLPFEIKQRKKQYEYYRNKL
ncbi:restriction endonuclease subunit S, partial [Ureaplasma parvum]|uniref:restriction endonuclease subunit S n=1 Tax=Ureaplasma parvum TaxID=134821 RepID=UPI0012FDB225